MAAVFPAQAGVFLVHSKKPRRVAAVFPAQAGVFPTPVSAGRTASGLPRASGGVSVDGRFLEGTTSSSPRKRGCFPAQTSFTNTELVFPAQAGVFPLSPHDYRP